MNRIEVIELEKAGREAEWQAYVEGAPTASAYHALEWRHILLRTFKHRSWYLMAREDGAVRGVLPLIEMRSSMFGHFFVSLPFLNYGGILADSPAHEAALATAAAELTARRGARHLELRQHLAASDWAESGWALRQHKAALIVPLDVGAEALWAKLRSRLRGKVRKAENSGATFSTGTLEDLDDFYKVFSLNMRDLGTPVCTPLFFQNILRFAKHAAVLLVRRQGQPVAGAIALRHRDRIELPWICSDYSQSSYYVNEYLYWRAIEWACAAGARALDLGRSSIGAGTYRFKMQWNSEAHPLFWYYWLSPGLSMPELNPSNPKYALAVSCWKRLPIGIANRIGPLIIRNVP